MNFIKEHKIAIIVISVCLILIILAGLSISKMMFPSSAEDINGDRLVNAVAVEPEKINQILTELKGKSSVIDATYNKNVRILKFFISFKSDTKLEDAKKLTSIIASNLTNDILNYYDIEVFLEADNSEFPAIGQCFKGEKTFYFNGDGGLEDEQ